jgi:hypothetical protein
MRSPLSVNSSGDIMAWVLLLIGSIWWFLGRVEPETWRGMRRDQRVDELVPS